MGQTQTHSKKANRIEWIDAGKSIAIFFVFYTHVTAIFRHDFDTMDTQRRFFSSFVLPFFFFLSGLLLNEKLPVFKKFFGKKFSTLIVPLFFFNILSLALLISANLLFPEYKVWEGPGSLFFRIIALFLAGTPTFNVVCWFLTCLFSIEMIHFFVAPMVTTNKRLIISMIGFSIIGYMIAQFIRHTPSSFDIPLAIKIMLTYYFWFIPSALVVIVFFQGGILVRRLSILEKIDSNIKIWSGLIISGLLLVVTSNLDYLLFQGKVDGQDINLLETGNYFCYHITNFTGITFAIFLSMLLKSNKFIVLFGKNTLVLLGINGIMIAFLHAPLNKTVIEILKPFNLPAVLLLIPVITLFEFVICYPFFKPINKCLVPLVRMASNIFTSKQDREKAMVAQKR